MLERIKRNILIVDDHPVCRQGISNALRDFFGEKCLIDEAFDAVSALKIGDSKTHDLILLDLQLPGASGLELAKTFCKKGHPAKIVIFSQSEDQVLLKELQELKIDGFISKSSSMDTLCLGLEKVFNGESYFDMNLSVLAKSSKNEKTSLTVREIEIVKLIVKGLTNKEAAQTLGCSEFTVKAHKSNIMQKIGVRNSAELVGWYFINQGQIS